MKLEALETALGNPKLTMLFYKSMKDYREIEEVFKEKFKEYSFYNEIEFKSSKYKDLEYFEKNFFSIFFISIFNKIGFEKEKVQRYGMIFHALRVIITAADNILDNEEKGSCILKIEANPVLKNILLIIMSDIIMGSEIKNNKSMKKIVETLYGIARGESISALKESENYPSSDFIREKIHKNIGGELLGIAFDIPANEEEKLKDKIMNYRAAITLIGEALQALDDMTDVREDIEGNKANLMTSIILEKNGITYQEFKKNGKYSIDDYKNEYVLLIEEAANKALNGFKIMEENLYPVNKKQGEAILKLMFKLRGLENEWDIYHKIKNGGS